MDAHKIAAAYYRLLAEDWTWTPAEAANYIAGEHGVTEATVTLAATRYRHLFQREASPTPAPSRTGD